VKQICGLLYRFHPTAEQAALLVRTFGCERWVVNRMIKERSRRWREEKKGMSYAEMSALLTEWKKDTEFAWLNEVSCVPLQQKLRHLEAGYKKFFAWCRARVGRKVGYPSFMKKRKRQSAEFTMSAFGWDGRTLTMAKSKQPLNLVWTQVFWGDPSMMTISLDPDGTWWVSLKVEVETSAAEGGRDAVGVDMGLGNYTMDDRGNRTDAPNMLRRNLDRLARAQRDHARKAKRGKNREKSRRKVARIHARVRRGRLDFLHKLSSRLIAENQVICVETLRASAMVRNRKLALSISDAAWGEFVRQLEYKAEWYGREVIKISQWEPSTRKCSGCGYRMKEMNLSVRAWTCPSCGMAHDRDVNAAINIRVAGLAILAKTASRELVERRKACGVGIRRLVLKDETLPAKTGAEWLRRKQEGPVGIRGEWKLAA
jgi:putative transposase